MARLLKNLLLGLLVVGGSHRAVAFSLLGPSPSVGGANNPAVAWQTVDLGYNQFNLDSGGPMNLGEEYRWNVPVITYAFDESFENYFGSNGVAAVEAAITILNRLTNVSKFSPNLTEFPLDTTRHNYQAEAVNLLDLKSTTLQVLLEELGLGQAERFVWTIRERRLATVGNVTTTNYFIIQRNFDPVTLVPSSYVNGVLYTYRVGEFDPGAGRPIYADAVEVPAQIPATSLSSSVASRGLTLGGYYTGITRDDAGGLRYLYRPDNMNVEDVLNDIQVAVTNTTTLTLLTNSDLATFTTRTVNTTNDPARLINLYPGLLITSTNAFLTNQFLTNITTFFTNFPAAATPVYVTNITPVIVTNFNYTFGNVVTNTNSVFTNNTVILRTVSVNLAPGFTPGLGTLITNIVTNSIVLSNYPNGEFYVRPTNLLDFQIVRTQLVQVVAATNVISSTFGNLFAFTNTATMVPVATGDLTLLAERSFGTTLTPAQITNLYPGILITRTNNRVTNVLFTNFVGTNVVITNGLAAVFDYTYGNVLTNVAVTNPTVRTQIVEIVASTNVGPGGTTFQTNLLVSGLTTSNFLSGEFTIVPTNLLGYSIVANLFTNVTEVTNIIFTNANAVFTNTGAPVDVFGFDLSDFIFLTQNTTNTPARLQTLYPGLFITGTNAFLTNVQTTNITTIFPGFPATNIPTLLTAFPTNVSPAPVLVTNFTSVLLTNFNYTFGNVATNYTATNNAFLRRDLTITQAAGVIPGQGAFVTNLTTVAGTTNYLNGEVIIRPTNLFGYSLLNTQILSVVTNTNVLSLSFGNLLAYTNDTALVPLITGDLTVLTEASYGTTNTAAFLTNLFPGIVITRTNIRVTNVFITNFVGNAALVTNTIGTVFDYTYGNVVTNVFTNRTWVTNRMVEVFVTTNVVGPGGPVFITNVLTGDIVAGGGSATNPATALLTPLGFNNDLLLTAATNGAALNGMRVRFIDDHTTVLSNTALAAFDPVARLLTIAIRTNVTDAGAVVRAINALSLPEGLTAGGETNKAGAAVTPFGANNDLLIQALATNVMATNAVTNIFTNFVFGGGVSLATNIVTNVAVVSNFNGVALRLLDDGSVTGGAATCVYDTASRVLTVRMQKAATTAATIVGAVATSGAAGMAAFRAGYAVTLNPTDNESGANTGLGALGVPLFIASLSAATAPDNVAGLRVNDGTGTLGANVGVATLETNLTRGQPFASGEFYIVPTNTVVANGFTNSTIGYDIRLPILTNVSTNVTLVITNATAVFTNTSVGTNIVTVDLDRFGDVVSTNSPAQLVAAFNTAFPGQPPLLVTGTNTYFTNLVTATVTNILVQSPYQSPLEPPQVVLVTNFTTNVVQRFAYTFGNVVTNPSPAATNGIIAFVNREIVKDPYVPAFTTNLITNITTTLVTSNFLNGVVYIVPTNLFGYSVISTQLVTVTNITNNVFTYVFTNSGNQVTNTLDLVQFVTNYYLNVQPIEFVNPTNVGVVGPGIRQEIVRFGTNTVYGVYPIYVASVPPQLSDGFSFSINGVGTRIELLTYSTNFIHRAYPVEFVNPTNVTGPGIRSEWVRFVTNTFKAAFPIELLTVPGSLGGGIGTNVEMITFSTNSVLSVNPIVWQSAAATPPILRRGVDKITFQRVQFDSLLGQGFLSVTNTYSDLVVTNSTNAAQYIRRINTRPDIVFRAEDLGYFLGLGGPIAINRTRANNWINNNNLNGISGLAGPGVIPPQILIDFNKVGANIVNSTPFFLTEPTATPQFVWGSFDGSTNAPIVYPLGSSITNLEQQVLTNAPAGP